MKYKFFARIGVTVELTEEQFKSYVKRFNDMGDFLTEDEARAMLSDPTMEIGDSYFPEDQLYHPELCSCTREEQEAEALERLRLIPQLLPEVIADFDKDKRLYISEFGVLYWLDQYPGMVEAVKRFEAEHNAVVYFATYDHMEFGDCLSMLYVSNYPEEWQQDRDELKDGYPFAYVENLDAPDCSEFGSIGIAPRMGSIIRVA